jgi:hypothetical protein
MRKTPKFGNNDDRADFWTGFVVSEYAKAMYNAGKNTRGGQYIAGLYSNTSHMHFGKLTGALPCGQCRHFDICNGNTRVRAQQLTGDPWAEDPGCYLEDEEIGVAPGSQRLVLSPYIKIRSAS